MHVLANGPAENGRQIAARLIDIDGDLGHGFAPLLLAASSLQQAGHPVQCKIKRGKIKQGKIMPAIMTLRFSCCATAGVGVKWRLE